MSARTSAETHTALGLARLAAGHLGERGVEDARLEAELLMAGLLGVERLQVYLQHDRPLTSEEVDAYRDLIRRRLRREPVQYILGSVAFRELELKIDRRALIPRPETEVLVRVVLERTEVGADADAGAPVAAELGTGSGAIALSLLAEGPFERVVATDVSAGALDLAGENAARLGLTGRLELRRGPLWQPFGAGERFHVVVSNPPYVAEGERGGLAPEVAEWEPAEALFAGADGLDVIRPIVGGAAEHLRERGLLALELGHGQADAVERLLTEAGYVDVETIEDYAGRRRIAVARRP